MILCSLLSPSSCCVLGVYFRTNITYNTHTHTHTHVVLSYISYLFFTVLEKGGIEIQIIQGRNLVIMDMTGMYIFRINLTNIIYTGLNSRYTDVNDR